MAITEHKGRINRAAPNRFPNQDKKLSDSPQQSLFELTSYDELEVESRKRSRPQSIVPLFRVATTYYLRSPNTVGEPDNAYVPPPALLAQLKIAMKKIPSELLAANNEPTAHQRDCVRAFLSELQQTAYDLARTSDLASASDHRPPSSTDDKTHHAFGRHIITYPAPPSRGSSADFYVVRPACRGREYGVTLHE